MVSCAFYSLFNFVLMWYMLVPVNLKEKDAFHLTIEEYLLALIGMVEELVGILLQ